jgi:hypothetical protein
MLKKNLKSLPLKMRHFGKCFWLWFLRHSNSHQQYPSPQLPSKSEAVTCVARRSAKEETKAQEEITEHGYF